MKTHLLSKHPLYSRWSCMKRRCLNEKAINYERYGGRGISVCQRWMKFENFFSDMIGGFSPELTLERKDNNGPYSPYNCVWATRTIQNNNTRTSVRWSHDGNKLSPSAWSKQSGIKVKTLETRIRQRGWTVEKALSTPVGIMVTVNGETLHLRGWETRLGVKHGVFWARIKRGWSPEKAVTTPVRKCAPRK